MPQETRTFNQASGLNTEANKKISAGKLGGSARKAVNDVTSGKSWDDQDMSEISGRRAPIDQFSDLSSERGSDRGDDPMDVSASLERARVLTCNRSQSRPSLPLWTSSFSSSMTKTEMTRKGLARNRTDALRRIRACQGKDSLIFSFSCVNSASSELPDIYLKELRKVQAYQVDGDEAAPPSSSHDRRRTREQSWNL